MTQTVEITPNGVPELINLDGFSSIGISGPDPQVHKTYRFVHVAYHHACGNLIACENVDEVYQQIKAALIHEGS